MREDAVIGCIGLGVMGEPICANLLKKSGCRVRGFDVRSEPLDRLAKEGLEVTSSVEDCYAALGIVHSLWRPIP